MPKTKEIVQRIVSCAPCDQELHFPIPFEVTAELDGYLDEGIIVSDGVLHLKDYATKSKIIAEYHYNALDKNDEFFFWEKAKYLFFETLDYKELNIIGEYILIGSKDIDIFSSVKHYIENNDDTFSMLHIIECGMNKQFPYHYKSFIDFFAYIYEKAENDLAIGYYIEIFCKFLYANEEYCLKIHSEYIICRNKFLIPLYNNIVINFYKKYIYMKDLIVDEIQKNKDVDANTIYLFGLILLDEKVHTGAEIDILEICTHRESEEQSQSAFSALALHLGKSQNIDNLFKQAVIKRNKQAILALAYKLSLKWTDFTDHPDFELWINSLAYIPLGLTRAERWRDHLFSQALSRHYGLVIRSLELYFFTNKAKNGAFDIEEVFRSTLNRFVKDDFLGTQLLLWLNVKNDRLARIASDIIAYASIRKVQYTAFLIDKLNIDDSKDLLFLCRRILGHVHAINFLLPAFFALAYFYNDNPLYLDIIFQCIDFIAFNYPPQTEKALEDLRNNYPETSLAKMAKDLLEKINNYFKSLHALTWMGELCPSRYEEVLFEKEKQKSISRHMQTAQEQSIFSQIAPTVPLKAGKAFFSDKKDFHDNPTPLVSYKTAIPLPRSILLDPVQYELELLQFRHQTQGEL
ncbi:MAG: hypothetical protein LBB34_04860 [Holosporales bacterium]|jgi:hypothetical protein|nr:hypothetical protein [Holosporales bacterium]